MKNLIFFFIVYIFPLSSYAQLKIDVFPEVGVTSGLLKEKEIYNHFHNGLTQNITETSKKKILLGIGTQIQYKKLWTLQTGVQYHKKENIQYDYRQRNSFYTDTSEKTNRYEFTKLCLPVLFGYLFKLKEIQITPFVGFRVNYFNRANINKVTDYKVNQPDRNSYSSSSYDPINNGYNIFGPPLRKINLQSSVASTIGYHKWQLSVQYHFKIASYSIRDQPLAPMQDVIDYDSFSNNDFVLSMRYLIPIKN